MSHVSLSESLILRLVLIFSWLDVELFSTIFHGFYTLFLIGRKRTTHEEEQGVEPRAFLCAVSQPGGRAGIT